MQETILPITSDNLDHCAELFVRVFNGAPWNDSWTFETAHKRLLNIYSTPNPIGFIYLSDGEFIGFAIGNFEPWFIGDIFYLKEMGVQTDKQGRQIGTTLLNHLNHDLESKAIKSSYLITLEGGQAEHFYRKNGYKKSTNSILMSCNLNEREN